ncbi:hypothetical protein BC829DRAFT_237072 [Chytridium lagenaria]|nr:hypothetical protein BC829DRAFT_237072 [Chytridium lagenaria]
MNIQRIADLKAANEVHEGHLREKDGDISRLNTTIKEHLVLEDELRQKIEENEIEINSLHQDLVFKGEEIANLQAESLKAIQDKEVELANEQSENIRRLHEEHITEAEKMVIEFDKAQSFLKKQIAAQAKQWDFTLTININYIRLQDADLRYINREPREADLQRIAELEDDIKRRKRKITALTEELDYYRLELNNREANFNKIFNKTPLVGVIEPLKFSPKFVKQGNKKETPSRLPPLFTSQTLNAALATSRTPSEI